MQGYSGRSSCTVEESYPGREPDTRTHIHQRTDTNGRFQPHASVQILGLILMVLAIVCVTWILIRWIVRSLRAFRARR